MRATTQWLAALVLLFAWTGRASATGTQTEATITVRIVLANPSTSPAFVHLSSADRSLDLTVDTLGERRAVFRHVPAGLYDLEVQVAGSHELDTTVHIEPATNHQFVAVMASVANPQAKSTLQLIDADSGGTRAFDRAVLDTLPADDPVWSVAEITAAPLIVDRVSNGGLWTGEAARVGGNGTSWRQTAISRGDLDVTDSVHTGSTFAGVNHAPIEGLLISTASLPASVGGPGPVLTIVPTTTETWTGSVSGGGISGALQARNRSDGSAPSIARFVRHRDSAAHTGGPVATHVNFFAATQAAASDRVERIDPTVISTSAISFFADINGVVGRDRLRISPSVDRGITPYPGRARFSDRNVRQRSVSAALQSSWDHWADNGGAWSVSGGFQTTRLDHPRSAATRNSGGVVERLLDGPVASLFAFAPGTHRRWNGRVDAEPAVHVRHLVTAGASAEGNVATSEAMATPPVAELVNGLPARVWQYSQSGRGSRWSSTEFAAYASDQIELPFRIRAVVGGRLEVARGSARGAANGISWQSFVPRLNARWLVEEAGRLAVSAGYARYVHHLPLDYFGIGDPAALTGRAYLWRDADGNRQFDEAERGALVAAVGPCCNSATPNVIDTSLRRPYTEEFFAAVDGRVRGWSIRIAAINRHERQLIATQNVGVAASDYTVRYLPDPGAQLLELSDDFLLAVYDRTPSSFGKDRYVLTNPPGHDANYLGLEVTVDRHLFHGWRTRFDGALYVGEAMGSNRGYGPLENDPGSTGELFDDPNAKTFARGHQFFDRAYVMKWWSTYAAPKQWLVSAVARYQDGQPFSRLVIVPDLNQGPEAVQAYRRGRTRFTFTLTVDAHVEKSFDIGRGNVSGIVEVFNLLNTRNEVEEDVVSGENFRRTTAVQPPRAARIAMRLRF